MARCVRETLRSAVDSFRNVCWTWMLLLAWPVVAILYYKNPVDSCHIYYELIDLPA